MSAPVRLRDPAGRREIPGTGALRQTGRLMTLAATTVRASSPAARARRPYASARPRRHSALR